MLQVTILNGATAADPFLDSAADLIKQYFMATGARVRVWRLREATLAPCQGCFDCWVKTPGLCRNRVDDGEAISRDYIQSDEVVYLTPVTFGGYSSTLKAALDRTIGLISPHFRWIGGEVHHRPRYTKYPGLLGIGALDVPDREQEQLFTRLLARNAINLFAPWNHTAFLYRDLPLHEVRAKLDRFLNSIDVEA